MKKHITVPVAVLAALTLSFSAGVKSSAVSNPWQKVTETEMNCDYGYEMCIPDDAENIVYTINSLSGLAEADFTLDGNECTLRVKSIDDFEDISGFYYNWDDTEFVKIGSRIVNERMCEHLVSCLWYDESTSCMYSLCVSGENATAYDAEQMIMKMYM